MITNADTINVGVLWINHIIYQGRVFTFDDSAVRADTATYARILLMAVDKVVGARVNRGCVFDTEVKLLAIIWVRKISV
jgi:hypothetical protein